MKIEQKVDELEKRIALLESQRPIINVYPYQQTVTPADTYYQQYPITGDGSDKEWHDLSATRQQERLMHQ